MFGSNSLAFGVEPGHAPYRLRQARYQALAEDVARFALEASQRQQRKIDLLDVGVFDGVSRRYLEVNPGAEQINYSAVDVFPLGREFVYKHEDWTLHHANLESGMPELPSDGYDVVVCEQVLEHLHNVTPALRDLARVLRPGGLMVLGVPIFPHGVHLIRKHVVPITDKFFPPKNPRGHVQAWSLRTFRRQVKESCDLEILQERGFRIVSGGVLRPLEYCRWWWRLNRRVGAIIPSACVEVQLLLTKRRPSKQAAPRAAA